MRDAGLLGAAQRVEHYEIAGDGTVRALGMMSGSIWKIRRANVLFDRLETPKSAGGAVDELSAKP